MPRVATKLAPTARGGFMARRVIPSDVREEYSKLYGVRTEERLNTGPMPILLARAKHREWSTDIETRVANIRAARKGEGRTLTPTEARGLAGEWYHWFIARQEHLWPTGDWDHYCQLMEEELQAAAIRCGIYDGDVFRHFEERPDVREKVRPILADEAKAEQFLAAKGLNLDSASRMLFLDFVGRDFFAAIALLSRRARGDFGPDKWAEQFPSPQTPADASLTPWQLFERWVEKTKPAISTVDRWRFVLLKLQSDFPTTSAAALLPEQAREWANKLISPERSARSVASIWLPACRTVFAFAVEEKLIARNPFAGWRIKVPKKIITRETKSFTNEEAKTILSAALNVSVRSKTDAAKRWCPWLAAYSGARMGELTQLRAADIIEQDGIPAIRITPEAGSTKTGKARVVPLHEHLIAQGFLDFMKASGTGPLFYKEATQAKPIDPTNPGKPRYVKTRERVAAWVRTLGVTDPELSPNHAWRHTFKAAAFRCGMPEKIIDAIVGHAPATVGRGYGEPTLADKANELSKFPRYDVAAQ